MISLKETLGLSLTNKHTHTQAPVLLFEEMPCNNLKCLQVSVHNIPVFFAFIFQEQGHFKVLLQPPNATWHFLEERVHCLLPTNMDCFPMLYFLSVSKWTMPFQFAACDTLLNLASPFSLSADSLIYVASIQTWTEGP